jgi:transcription initiation factor IIE alpha subunit
MAIIEFLCPNGHKIRCQAEQAGQAAKCPRCGVKFRVPDPTELNAGQSDVLTKQDFNDIDFAEEKPASQNGSQKNTASKKEQQMEFLCPNGHRLFGSTNLAGRLGECPDCGARFRIPSLDEVSLDEKAPLDPSYTETPDLMLDIAATSTPPVSTISSASNPIVASSSSKVRQNVKTAAKADPESSLDHEPAPARTQSAWEDEVMPATVWSIAAGSALVDQPVATLFARLWTTRPKGARIEIQMHDGEAVVVEQFMASLSQQSHGVFCILGADATFTLMAVAWSTIDRVLVRGLSEMPKP